ncbi:33133_t:CDS:2 [Gigaspora margarita]|uniref:33133_t:CDS:1 n=1 Tax=Gigaspora margarita TaxID=4874 RepID=A0ABN7UCX3_GIGMA|nr:33133_t:CDS:2 [Gigaspora margarita]
MGEKNLSYYEFLSSKQSGIIHILKYVNEPDNWLPIDKAWYKRFENVAEEQLGKNISMKIKNKTLSEFKKPISCTEISEKDAHDDFIKGDIQLLRSSLLTRSSMSLAPANEEVLQGDGRYGFVDLFVLGEAGQGITLELKYISVVGLLKARTGEMTREFHTDELLELDKELEKANEQKWL